MKFRQLITLLMVFAITTSLFEACQSAKSNSASAELKLGLEKGKGYDYEMNTNMDQEILGIPIKMNMDIYYSMDVIDDNGEVKTMRATYERFKLKAGAMGQELDVDTERPVPDDWKDGDDKMAAVNKIFGAIKGKGFLVKINGEGKILEVSGMEDMMRSMVDSLGLDEDKLGDEMKGVKEEFNEDKMKQQLERMFYFFPNKKVKVGDSWTRKTTVDDQIGGAYNSTFTVKEIEGNIVTLEEESTIEGLSVKKEDDVSGVNPEIKGKVTGTLVVDSRLGLLVSGDQEVKITVSANGMSIDMTGTTKIKGKMRE
ncbi:MAG TPA: DUF6263 family protein [Chitinophagaceae bacterium]|nr:hypothetical protein [Chitinophagaceae bacterium]HPG10290.1 DUF6263 family protein [Chitinophagaceae bacterium]HRX94176.1 DUF6263 family protein [Chitinophagaceae bacterium]